MNEKESHKVAEALAKVLADVYLLYTKTQNYHWNYTGPEFYSLHLLFEKQYEDLAESVDEIAERIRALGHVVEGTMRAFLKRSTLKEDDKPIHSSKMLAQLLADHRTIINELRKLSDLAERSGDPATTDLMGRRLNAHEKFAWMLESNLRQ